MKTKNAKQTEHFVAFLDVLGYSNIVESNDPNEVEKFFSDILALMKVVTKKII